MKKAATFRAVIFDFDGVLVNTISLHYSSYRRLFASEGVTFTFGDYQRVANGAPRHRVIRAVLGDDLPEEKFQALMERKETIVRDLASRGEGLKPLDGVLDLVHRLRNHGLLVGVASSSRTAAVFLRTMKIELLFHAVTDGLETMRSKPHPEVFIKTARKFGVPPEHCLVFEDASVGVTAARAAGMSVVGITTTTPAEDLREANWVIDSFVGFDETPILFPTCVAES